MVGKFYQIPTFFEAGMGLEKVSFSTSLYKRDAFSHFLIRDWEASQSKNHVCGEEKVFIHILDCEASQYSQLECVKRPCFTNMWLLLRSAIIVNRCISKICILKMAVKWPNYPVWNARPRIPIQDVGNSRHVPTFSIWIARPRNAN